MMTTGNQAEKQKIVFTFSFIKTIIDGMKETIGFRIYDVINR